MNILKLVLAGLLALTGLGCESSSDPLPYGSVISSPHELHNLDQRVEPLLPANLLVALDAHNRMETCTEAQADPGFVVVRPGSHLFHLQQQQVVAARALVGDASRGGSLRAVLSASTVADCAQVRQAHSVADVSQEYLSVTHLKWAAAMLQRAASKAAVPFVADEQRLKALDPQEIKDVTDVFVDGLLSELAGSAALFTGAALQGPEGSSAAPLQLLPIAGPAVDLLGEPLVVL